MNKTKLKIIIFIIILITSVILWARFISTKGLYIKEIPIKTTKLDTNYDGFKIIHFTDLHYGSTVELKELKNVINLINNQKPDIIVFTGDLVEKGVKLTDEEIEKISNEFNKLNPSIETLAIKGNHDYESEYFDKIVEKTNWHILTNTYEYVYSKSNLPIIFVGLDDLTLGKPDYANAFSYLNIDDENYYTIVLSHEPDQVSEYLDYPFNLILSGHSHLGQVRFPLIGAIYTPVGSKKYYDEHYKIKDADMYINGGIGTSTIKLRFFNKPSISLYRFYTK